MMLAKNYNDVFQWVEVIL